MAFVMRRVPSNESLAVMFAQRHKRDLVSPVAFLPHTGVPMTSYFLESVDRVMKVLNAFTIETPELRLTDLSERLGLPKPQVLRIVSTLETGGYVARDPQTKRYRLGIQMFHLGMVVRQGLDLRRIAHPLLQQLADETHETVGVFIVDPLGPLCIDFIDSPKGLRVFAQLGRRMPWNAGTSAKAILAYLPDDQREAILARGDFKRYTNRTVIDPDHLRDELEDVRCHGYHIGRGDLDVDAAGVAAPIFDHDNQVTGAISLSAPTSRTSDQEMDRFTRLVCETAGEISRRLGYLRPVSTELGVAADD
jgi:IclR family transcriptional regulator, KDG regulon repressor